MLLWHAELLQHCRVWLNACRAAQGDGQEEELPMKGNVEIQEEELAPEEEDDEEAIKVTPSPKCTS